MVKFRYCDFYDVPRCIVLRYRGKLLLLQSVFDDELDDYPDRYSVYELPDNDGKSLPQLSLEFLTTTPSTSIGEVRVAAVKFDSSKRKELDPSVLDALLSR